MKREKLREEIGTAYAQAPSEGCSCSSCADLVADAILARLDALSLVVVEREPSDAMLAPLRAVLCEGCDGRCSSSPSYCDKYAPKLYKEMLTASETMGKEGSS